jgi:hypothetical protein
LAEIGKVEGYLVSSNWILLDLGFSKSATSYPRALSPINFFILRLKHAELALFLINFCVPILIFNEFILCPYNFFILRPNIN